MYGLLECYGKPKASITRLRMEGKGSYNLSKNADEVLWKKQVYFKTTDSDKLLTIIDEMKLKWLPSTNHASLLPSMPLTFWQLIPRPRIPYIFLWPN